MLDERFPSIMSPASPCFSKSVSEVNKACIYTHEYARHRHKCISTGQLCLVFLRVRLLRRCTGGGSSTLNVSGLLADWSRVLRSLSSLLVLSCGICINSLHLLQSLFISIATAAQPRTDGLSEAAPFVPTYRLCGKMHR